MVWEGDIYSIFDFYLTLSILFHSCLANVTYLSAVIVCSFLRSIYQKYVIIISHCSSTLFTIFLPSLIPLFIFVSLVSPPCPLPGSPPCNNVKWLLSGTSVCVELLLSSFNLLHLGLLAYSIRLAAWSTDTQDMKDKTRTVPIVTTKRGLARVCFNVHHIIIGNTIIT
jgi:hypothetical protein